MNNMYLHNSCHRHYTRTAMKTHALIAFMIGSCACLSAQKAPVSTPFKLLDIKTMQRVEQAMFAEVKRHQPDQSWPVARPEAVETWKDLRFGLMLIGVRSV